MASINKVILVGNLGADPEIKHMQNGDPVANLSVATADNWKDKQTGEKKERTEWHRVVIFGGIAGVAEKYLRKGSKVYLEGQLQTRKWQDQSGSDKYTTEIVVQGFGGALVMLDSKADGASNGATGGQYHDHQAPAQARTADEDLDDEIPF